MANSKRGFAAMSAEEQRKIASMGGKASHGSRSSRSTTSGAAGSTEAASLDGQHRRRGS